MRPLIIAIDGPAGSGKTSVSKRVALYYHLPCLDTGAMYRRVALEAIRRGIALDNEAACCDLATMMTFRFDVKGADFVQEVRLHEGPWELLGPEIRSPEISMGASQVAGLKELRKIMVAQQQELGRQRGAVVEGRDAGTAIFPESPHKFYITASAEERARRRFEELKGIKGMTFDQVLAEVKKRDLQDASRLASPLIVASDAVVIDTTGASLDDVVRRIAEKVGARSTS